MCYESANSWYSFLFLNAQQNRAGPKKHSERNICSLSCLRKFASCILLMNPIRDLSHKEMLEMISSSRKRISFFWLIAGGFETSSWRFIKTPNKWQHDLGLSMHGNLKYSLSEMRLISYMRLTRFTWRMLFYKLGTIFLSSMSLCCWILLLIELSCSPWAIWRRWAASLMSLS